MLLSLFVVLVVAAQCAVPVRAELDALKAAELSRTIREHFRATGMNWVSPKMLAKEIDLQLNVKPIMYLFTATSCADCRVLMNGFADFDAIMLSQLSSQFLSVIVLDDYQLDFGPDFNPINADYLPRIIFADPDGTLRWDLKNPASDAGSPYFYGSAQEVVTAMQTTLMKYREEWGISDYPSGLEEDI